MPFPRKQVQLVGNLGKEPDMRYTNDGRPVTAFSLAVSEEYKSKEGEKVKETIWVRVSAFGKLAELCKSNLRKGMQVLVIGSLKGDKSTGNPVIWTKQDGSAGSSFEVQASEVWPSIFSLGNGGSGFGFEGAEIPPEDDIPF